MSDVYEKDLTSKTPLTPSDFIRVVGSENVSYKQLISDVAACILEAYSGSTFGGSEQTVKEALDGLSLLSLYSVCETGASTAAKTISVSVDDFTLTAGQRVTIKFENTNTAESPTINVNSTGAKSVYYKGSQIVSGSEIGLLSDTVDLIYNGSAWVLIASASIIDPITDAEIESIITGVTPDPEFNYVLEWFYPVGTYYETSSSSFNPNTAWGGTWVLDPDAGSMTIDNNASSGTIDAALTTAINALGFTNIDSTNAVYRWHRTA